MTGKIFKPVVTVFFAFLLASPLSPAGTLQGKLEKFGPLGILPAPFLKVTLTPGDNDKTFKTGISNPEGIYSFENCPPGTYTLNVWIKGPGEKSLDFRVNVLDQPVTNLAPLLIHYLKIDSPKEGENLPRSAIIRIKGTHYNLPGDTYLWIVLQDKNGNYSVPDKPVNVNPGGTWETLDLSFDSLNVGGAEILLILVTGDGNRELRLKEDWEPFPRLPANSLVIARRKIVLH